MSLELKIDITWDGPRDVPYDADQNLMPDIPQAYVGKGGFYCIYGQHPVYGSRVLLYIGETKSGRLGAREFATRVREHIRGRFWGHTNLAFHFGVSEQSLSDRQVRAVESILIAAHKPALNRKYIDSPAPEAEGMYLRNWGNIGALLTECSGDYWLAA